ncbi:MAG: ABC transporter permease [Bacillota bacterium]|nr:ABC transporter permease [Bacillota bacterium]
MIFKREFKRNIKSLLIWSIVLGGLVLMMLSVYPQFAKDKAALNELLKAYPESMKNAFGMDKLNFGTVMGFYGVEIYVMTTLIGSIYAAIMASNIIAKESNDKTIEFLLSKPVSRSEIIFQKLLAVTVNIILLNAVIVLVSVIGFQFAENEQVPVKAFVLISTATFLLHMTFAAISFLLSAIMRKTRNILSISMGIVFVEYFFHIMSGVTDKLKNLQYVSVFSYVDASEIISNNAMETLYVIIMTAIIIICFGSAFIVYKKKDITV